MRFKVLTILVGAILLFLVLDFTIHRLIIFQSYLALEETEAGKDIARCLGALEREIEHLGTLAYDWASWDDTYRFVQDRNEDYIASNLVFETFIGNDLNLIVIYNTQREMIWGQVRTPDTHEEINIEEFFPRNPRRIQGLFEPTAPGESVSGVWITTRFPMLISSRPITTSDDQGPIAGYLIMGRVLTEAYVEKLSEQIQVPHRYDIADGRPSVQIPREITSRITADNPYVFNPVSSQLLRAYAFFPDILGRPVLLLQADIERSITSKGHAAIWVVLISISVFGGGLLVAILLLLNRFVVHPLSDLTAQVVDFGEHQRFSPGPLAERRDEIGQLYREFRNMTGQLQRVHRGYQETNIRLEREVREHRLTETELRLNEERLRALSSELVMTEERERRRIAVELHDRIGQALAVLRMQVELLLKQAPVDGENAKKIRVLIENIIHDSRTLIFEISPPVLYELGLGPAIEWLADEIMEQHDIHISVEDRLEATIEDSIRALIFRSIRELLYNVVKHAKADRAWVRLCQEENNLRIVVEDNGVGLPDGKNEPDADNASGYGLFSIRERLRQLGGKLEITPGENGGTVVTLSLALAFSRGILLEKRLEGL